MASSTKYIAVKKFLPALLLVFIGLSFSYNKNVKGNAEQQQVPASYNGPEKSYPVASNFFEENMDGPAGDLKINQIQIIASHNSYHLRTEPAILRFLTGLYNLHLLSKDLNPKYIDYTNAPLTDQLEKYGVRGLELDVWNDPTGGRFYKRKGRALVFKPTASKIEALKQPGFKLLHIPDFDFISTNLTLVDALKEIKRWSDAHPNHLPVFINIETEVSTPGDEIKFLNKLTHAAPFDSLAAENLDKEVKSVFGEKLDGVLTPDEVRGKHPTLEKAVLAGNWPTIKEAKGKVIFIIDGDGNSGEVYKTGHPSLAGRALFVYSNPGTPEAAFVIFNDPKSDFANIQKRVKEGYIIRTRSDDGTKQARSGDSTDMHAALSSWAQIVSTDYYRPDPRAGTKGWSDYCVQLPGGVHARIDSISAPNTQKDQKIKE